VPSVRRWGRPRSSAEHEPVRQNLSIRFENESASSQERTISWRERMSSASTSGIDWRNILDQLRADGGETDRLAHHPEGDLPERLSAWQANEHEAPVLEDAAGPSTLPRVQYLYFLHGVQHDGPMLRMSCPC